MESKGLGAMRIPLFTVRFPADLRMLSDEGGSLSNAAHLLVVPSALPTVGFDFTESTAKKVAFPLWFATYI